MLLLAGLVMHFALTTVYSFRDNMPYRAYALADKYSVPCFHQNWKLFAPDLPKYTVQLEYRTVINSVDSIKINGTTTARNNVMVTKTANGEAQFSIQNASDSASINATAEEITAWSPWHDATGDDEENVSQMETIEQGFCTQLSNQLLNNLYRKNDTIQYDRVIASAQYAAALYYVMKYNKADAAPYNIWQIRLRYVFTAEPGTGYEAKEEIVEFPSYTHLTK
jgi:hypothetical protein